MSQGFDRLRDAGDLVTAQPHHRSVRARFVDEHQPRRVKHALLAHPAPRAGLRPHASEQHAEFLLGLIANQSDLTLDRFAATISWLLRSER